MRVSLCVCHTDGLELGPSIRAPVRRELLEPAAIAAFWSVALYRACSVCALLCLAFTCACDQTSSA